MKGKYVLKNKKRFFFMMVTMMVMLSAVFYVSTAYGCSGREYDTVRVERGDTLWNIAQRYSQNGDIRLLVYKIKKANNMEDSIIYEGSYLKIPI